MNNKKVISIRAGEVMRVNIEWFAPWVMGPPFTKWVFHCWKRRGWTLNKMSYGFTLFGFYVSISFDALICGLSFSINLWRKKPPIDERFWSQ